MQHRPLVALAAAFALSTASVAVGQTTSTARAGADDYYWPTEPAPPVDAPISSVFEISQQSEPSNAYGALAIGLAFPGFIAFQGSFSSFGAIAPGLYTDLRLTGTTGGQAAFGTGSPVWIDSFEIDMRVGYGSREIDRYKTVIRDDHGRKISARIPGTFGITPYLGWRGRWGYRAQSIRLGLHVERESNAEVRFEDGRIGSNFKHFAFDFELSYTAGDQKGLGGALGYDHWFNEFVFFRGEFGFARPNQAHFAPNRDHHVIGDSKVSGAEGFYSKALIGFAFRFDLPTIDTGARTSLAASENESDVRTREQEREASARATERRPYASENQPQAAPAMAATLPPASAYDNPGRTTSCTRSSDCDDAIFCNGEESCLGGICQPGTLPDDGIACTQLVCDEEARLFRYEPLHGLCGDGNFCNGTERCDPKVGCVAGTPLSTDDGDPCTRDYCDDSLQRIVNEPIPGCVRD